MTPGLSHVLIALGIMAVHAIFAGLLVGDGVVGVWIGAAAGVWFYIGRERRQSEEHFGSNRIPPWRWKPRALRDAGWPALACFVAALAFTLANLP